MSGYPFAVHPFCCSCQVPVEEMRIIIQTTRVVVHAKCHGKTDSRIVPIEDVIRVRQILMFRGAFSNFNMVGNG